MVRRPHQAQVVAGRQGSSGINCCLMIIFSAYKIVLSLLNESICCSGNGRRLWWRIGSAGPKRLPQSETANTPKRGPECCAGILECRYAFEPEPTLTRTCRLRSAFATGFGHNTEPYQGAVYTTVLFFVVLRSIYLPSMSSKLYET